MRVFPRSAIQQHAVGALWPEFLGTVQLGESFVVETERYNAVNGPLQVAGVKAGEGVAIHVEEIEMAGPFEAQVEPAGGGKQSVPLEYEDNCFYFPGQVRLRARPTVGNLGILPRPTEEVLALSQRAQATGWGWRHVMNAPRGRHCHQDCPWLAAGATLHLKAQVDGVGVCVADVHGYQPAGTISFSGIEVSAAVRLRVERSHGWRLHWPLIETDREIMVLISHSTVLEHRPHPDQPNIGAEAFAALRDVVSARLNAPEREVEALVAAAMDLRQCAVRELDEGPGVAPGELSPWDYVVVAAMPRESLARR